MILALDTETTGLDLYHNCKPFYVSTCHDDTVRSCRWRVDPRTRNVLWKRSDLDKILTLVEQADTVVMQNGKFDVAALSSLDPEVGRGWPWEKTVDLMLASHVLASNAQKDLGALGVRYLGIDVSVSEGQLDEAAQEARRLVRKHKLPWMVAKDKAEGMPSSDKKLYKADMWLPRQLAQYLKYEPGHPWYSVLETYADEDAEVTAALWPIMEREIRRRGYWKIFVERNRAMGMAYRMERRGTVVLGPSLTKLTAKFEAESEQRAQVCVGIAKSYDFDLKLPAGGVNDSLRDFMFERLDVERVFNKKAKTQEPTLNKQAMQYYTETMEHGSDPHRFVTTLLEKRAYDTAVSYMKAYQRFWVPTGRPGIWRLHPFINPASSNTLRWTSNNPNEQNIGKKKEANIRVCFGWGPGREGWSLDARGIEDRLPAFESKEPELMEIFLEPKKPPYYGSNHFLRFHTVYPDLWDAAVKLVGLEKAGPYIKEEYASTWYQWVKNGGFAVQYGAIDREDGFGTADTAFHRPGSQARLRQRFNKLEALNQKQIALANKYGYVETIPDRSVDPDRGYPLLVSRSDYGKIKPTVPLNYHIQGSAMWWTHMGQYRAEQQLEAWYLEDGFDGYITMQVHDELVLNFPKAADPRVDPARSNLARVQEIARLMSLCGDHMGVPTPVGISYHPNNWGQGFAL